MNSYGGKDKLRRDSKILGRVDRKLALSFGAVVLLLMLTTSSVASFLFAKLNTKEEDRLSGVIAAILSESISRISFSGKYHTRLMAEEIQSRVPELAYISVETKDGRVFAHSDPAKNDTSMMEKEDVDLRMRSLNSEKLAVGEHIHEGKTFKEVVLPYRSGLDAEVTGVVRIGINTEEARGEQRATLFRLFILVSVLTAAAIWVVLVFSERFGGTVHALASQLQGILNHAPLAIGISDRAGRLRESSVEFEHLFGSPAVKQPLRQLFEERLSDTDVQRLADSDREVFESCAKKEQDLELVIQGRFRAWQVSKFPIALDKGGKPTLICTFIHDITKRKQAEEALRWSLSFAEKLIEAIPDPVFYKDTNGLYLGCNSAFAKALGLSIDEVIGKSVYDISPRELADKYYEMDSALFAGPGFQTYENAFMHADGSLRNVIFRKSTFSDHHGNLAGMIGVMIDITERKQMEDALREKEERYRLFFDNAPLGIMHFDFNGVVQDLNDKFAEIIGAPREAILGFNLIEGLRDPAMLQAVKDALDGETGYFEGDYTSVTGGKTTTLRAIFEHIVTEDGRVMGAVGLFEDISERKRAEEEREKLQGQLLQAQKIEAVGRLAGGVAHDFNNMLGVILGHTELALNRTNPDDPRYLGLQEIHKAARRSADLTRQLLAFARKQTVSPKVLDLNDTVSSMIKMLQRLIGEDIDLTWMPGHNIWSVRIDPSQVDQLLANLAINARDAIAGVGKVTIETANAVFDDAACADRPGLAPGEYVLLAVSDNGAGMGKEVLDHIFEPFFTTKEVGKGTGLGLATVYGTVKQNQGYVNVYSEPGQGTTFKIYLPRFMGEAVEPGAEISTGEPPVGTETVLIVEDEEAIRDLGKTILEGLGYTVLTAGTPGKAIRLAGEYAGDIQLLITDVVMPEMNGRELSERLTSINPGLKCLFMSGYTANAIAHHGVLDEGVHFIQKPFSIRAMAEKVREVLDS